MKSLLSKAALFFKELSFSSVFVGPKGALPKGFYLIPPLLWGLGLGFWLTLPQGILGASTKGQIADAFARDLQEDINLISEKVKSTGLLNMSKKDMIKDSKKRSFLGQKARQQLDKSEAAQSAGQFDGQALHFDSALNRIVTPDLSPTLDNTTRGKKTTDKITRNKAAASVQDLDYVMDKLKAESKSAYQNKPFTEQQRIQQLESAKAKNRKRRAALEQGQSQLQAQAYEKAILDNEKRYRHFYNMDQAQAMTQTMAKGKKSHPKKTTSQKTALKNPVFNTHTGRRDELQMQQAFEPTVNQDEAIHPTPKVAFAAQQAPLLGIIDQAQKVKSGDKIQIRLQEEAFYQGFYLPPNTLLYGICRLNSDRIQIHIPSIQINGAIIPSKLTIFDSDGLEGIYVDGSFNDLTREAIQEGLTAGNALGIRNSLGTFSLKLGRKANNRRRVYVPSGYPVFIYDAKN